MIALLILGPCRARSSLPTTAAATNSRITTAPTSVTAATALATATTALAAATTDTVAATVTVPTTSKTGYCAVKQTETCHCRLVPTDVMLPQQFIIANANVPGMIAIVRTLGKICILSLLITGFQNAILVWQIVAHFNIVGNRHETLRLKAMLLDKFIHFGGPDQIANERRAVFTATMKLACG